MPDCTNLVFVILKLWRHRRTNCRSSPDINGQQTRTRACPKISDMDSDTDKLRTRMSAHLWSNHIYTRSEPSIPYYFHVHQWFIHLTKKRCKLIDFCLTAVKINFHFCYQLIHLFEYRHNKLHNLCSWMVFVLVIFKRHVWTVYSNKLRVMIKTLEFVSKWLALKSHILIHNNPKAWRFVFIWYSNESLSISFKWILS